MNKCAFRGRYSKKRYWSDQNINTESEDRTLGLLPPCAHVFFPKRVAYELRASTKVLQKKGGLSESHALWRSVVTHSAFANCFIVLLFTFDNTFRQKIQCSIPRQRNFPAEMKICSSDSHAEAYVQATATLVTQFISTPELNEKHTCAFFVDLLDQASYDNTMRDICNFVPRLLAN